MKKETTGSGWQPKTGAKCSCKRGQQRDNCPNCEGTGYVIDFAAIRARHSKISDTSNGRENYAWGD